MNAGNVTQVLANLDNDAAAEFQLNILDLGVLRRRLQGGRLHPLGAPGLPGRPAGARDRPGPPRGESPQEILGIV